MKRVVVIALCSAVVAAYGAPAQAAGCAPEKLVHVTFVDVTPGRPSTSSAQPVDFYRIGSDRVRTEGAADPANKLHALAVIAEPDIWLVNLYDGTGSHIVDPGPTFDAKAPLFGRLLPGKLTTLEIGCEPAFLAEFAPKPVRQEQIGSTQFDVYRVEEGTDAVELLELPGTKKPSYARYFSGGKLVVAFRYDRYDADLANDPQLFARPPGITFKEAK
jgi:hypothetical protein